ncbi:MAG: regulatory iron-sulfur-containing complex subunit RicT [Candidatus Cloacimonetes bacterium]|jgi:cell fate regulator YaaT (PSP1 superfamily)|nr:Tpl protein [Candidatus Cloacimonadota bacterium]MDY0299456.1 regulatory iron-sulfur-containing complex subunit RicT [Candidatus Cloacimonadaceae bacterium]MCB5278463.1 Tpl protein [Candidatus Cloacimonadota bacterium]MCK9332828.1 Tpl protein [Candidatus Cloacimonadota bacterium]MDD2210038.1 regulatory iron-sulfur-containing complex subunit RicT [Candidatus Cloacimonadota bacterium]
MQEYIEVEFRSGRMGYYLNPDKLSIQPEDLIIVEVERGEDIAQIVHMAVPRDEKEIPDIHGRIYKIRRCATADDLEKLNNLGHEEEKATNVFNDILLRYSFEMKLIETVYQFDGNKLTFFFTADGRIDFRAFVRELATIFKTRIELHQTTGRDEAKRLGGFGMCGNPYCCSSFLKRFNQVTIKMAKDQNLAGNLSKISGPCGRLLCCLNFEEDFYVEEGKGYPIIGTCVSYKDTRAMVFRIDVLAHKIYLTTDDQNIIELDPEEFSTLKIISIPDLETCQ